MTEVSKAEPSADATTIALEEEATLERVVTHVEQRRSMPPPLHQARASVDYDAQLLSLRDELSTARQEDQPPLLEQMERLQSLADQRRREQTDGHVDLRSPYFGRMVLREQARTREVLIGRGTYLDTKSGIRIVDWRDAPVSRLYYRYQEGEDYNEVFGDREVEGEILTRRSVTITDGRLRRITCPQGVFARLSSGWTKLDGASSTLSGGEGSAPRPDRQRRGSLGIGDQSTSEDKSLREITALIDRHQFDLITRPDSGLVVIQGGAGSGKTTIGLHRLAYLNYADPKRFRPDRLLVVVFNQALCRYIAQVLPSLGIEGVAIRTYADWVHRLRTAHLPLLPNATSNDTPAVVSRLKKHPCLLPLIDKAIRRLSEQAGAEIVDAVGRFQSDSDGALAVEVFAKTEGSPLRHRAHALLGYVERAQARHPTDLRVALGRIGADLDRRARDVVGLWAEIFSDRALLSQWFAAHAPGEFSQAELRAALDWCAQLSLRVLHDLEQRREGPRSERPSSVHSDSEGREASEQLALGEPRRLPRLRPSTDDEEPADEFDDDRSQGIDGSQVEELVALDQEDDTLLLLLHQRLRGPLLRGTKEREALVYEHILVDEAQDYSPIELRVLLGTMSSGRSVTLAGDTAQRLHLDNGFSDWASVLRALDQNHVEIEPLCLSYRSTQPIVELAHHVLGPFAPSTATRSSRAGVPVELFRFSHIGDAGGFLADQLRLLLQTEPRASVAVIARFPEQADRYFEVLEKGEVPHVRRIAEQDFPFRPGVDVTDVTQVKGLEFDYVILVEVTSDSYPDSREARHLLHIALTRASHQLWIVACAEPSRLLPSALLERAL